MKFIILVLMVLFAGCIDTYLTPQPDAGKLTYEQFMEAVENNKDFTVSNVDKSFSTQRDNQLKSDSSREDIEWGEIYLKADGKGIHYNLNQPANSADSLADNWTLIFAFKAPFRAEDILYFCGPVESFNIQLIDSKTQTLLYDDIISKVQQCKS